jgi:hypothetical protein
MKRKRKLLFILLLVFLLSSLVMPLVASAAPLTGITAAPQSYLSGEPWYAKPIVWILQKILEVFGGIHDPADHVFYHS